MSENTRKQQIDSYNFDKDMKGLVINPRYIIGLQQIVSKLKEKNIGILITDHNVHETLSITDRAYLLFEGKILKS